jgi:hypothetical protein
MTKLLVVQGDDHYLFDLDKTKPKPLHEVLVDVGSDELLIARTDELDLTSLTGLLSSALSARSAPVSDSKTTRTTSPAKPAPKYTRAEVYEWAQSKGLKMSDRGRIPGEVLDKYLEAFPDKK